MTYLSIQQMGISESGKTKIFQVFSMPDKVPLGEIKWYASWRKYTFQPYSATVWDFNCLTEIIEFLNMLKEERKNANNQR